MILHKFYSPGYAINHKCSDYIYCLQMKCFLGCSLGCFHCFNVYFRKLRPIFFLVFAPAKEHMTLLTDEINNYIICELKTPTFSYFPHHPQFLADQHLSFLVKASQVHCTELTWPLYMGTERNVSIRKTRKLFVF